MRLVKRSFSLSGHRTSVALEPPFWDMLHTMAAEAGLTLAGFVARIDAGREPEESRASRLRIAALRAALTSGKATSGDPASR